MLYNYNRKHLFNQANAWHRPVSDYITKVCRAPRCLTCRNLSPSRCFVSSVTGHHLFFDNSAEFSCKSDFIVYLIECTSCNVQYVGSTTQPLHKRMNGHRSSVKKLNTYFARHFQLANHSFKDVRIKIIDAINVKDYPSKLEATSALHKLEQHYIDCLVSLFPLGLNDRTLKMGTVSANTISHSAYFCSPIPRRKRSHGCRKSYKPNKLIFSTLSLNNSSIISELYNLFSIKNFHGFYLKLKSLNNNCIKYLNNSINEHHDKYFIIIIKSFYFNKISNKHGFNVDKSNFILVEFLSKEIDKVKLHSLFSNKQLLSKIPDCISTNFKKPMFMYKLNRPLCTIVYNYNRFLKSLDLNKLQEIHNSSCHCEEYPNFIYKPVNHVITGDMNIIQDPKLRNVLKMGPKIRANGSFNKKKIYDSLCKSFDDYISRVSTKNDFPVSHFTSWRKSVFRILRFQVFNLRKNINNISSFDFSFQDVRNHPELRKLQQHFIICSIDKASSNYSLVCKKHYTSILVNELGFNPSTLVPLGNDTYQPVTNASQDIVTEHVSVLSNLFEINVSDSNKKIPLLFAIPKMHKVPYKFRFISGARACSTKQISVLLNNALLVIRNKLKADCFKACSETPFNYFLSINSTNEFLTKLKCLPEVWHARVYDFSTLYTKLNLESVKTNLFQLFDDIFNAYTRKFLCVPYNKGSGFFSHKPYNSFYTFNKSLIKEAVNFVLFQTFTIFAGQCFKQIKGVPMGGNCSPLLADLFLCVCEIDFLKAQKEKGNFNIYKILSKASRYIDDIVVYDFKYFHNYIHDIYPTDLQVDRSGDDPYCVDYLDVNLLFSNGKVQTSVFHKVELFNFNVTTLTFPENCAPISLGYNVFAGQVLRYGRICSNLNMFVLRVKKTVNLLSSRGYVCNELTVYFLRILHKHNYILQKFDLFGAQQLVDQIFE